jgi:redox-sensitive bicupin YhaK (pirin superfamily)
MMQLWVNLPAAHKMDDPGYQGLTAGEMGKVTLPGGGTVTVVAGSLHGVQGPARTCTPINLWDVRLGPGESAGLAVPRRHNVMVFVLDGVVRTAGHVVEPQRLAVFEHDGDALHLAADVDGARFVVLGGEPINEPVASYGPFVMNSREELVQAIEDFNAGTFGRLD